MGTGYVATAQTLVLYRLDEASAAANATDATGNSNLTAHASPGVATGQIGGARSFNGTTQYFEGASTAGAKTAMLGEWTMGAWVYLTAATTHPVIEHTGAGTEVSGPATETSAQNQLGRMLILSSGALQWYWETGLGVDVAGSTTQTVPLNTLTHVALVKFAETGGTYGVRAYINGFLVQTWTGNTAPTDGSSGQWFIGKDGGYTSMLTGNVDDVFVEARALTSAEIRAIYRRGTASFETEILRDGRGLCLYMDISTDGFDSVDFRYGTASGVLDGTNQYQKRLLSVGRISRGFGQDNIAASGIFEVVLDNTDEGADWMCDRATAADMLKARYRLFLGIYDLADSGEVIFRKQLGEFVATGFPRRDDTTVRFQLADEMLGLATSVVSTMTLSDWQEDAGSDTSNCPFKQGDVNPNDRYVLSGGIEMGQQLPLAWGEDFIAAVPIGHPFAPGSTFQYNLALMICVTASTDAVVVGSDITELWYKDKEDEIRSLPRFFADPLGAYGQGTLWQEKKSQTVVTADGRSWRALYIEVNIAILQYYGHVHGISGDVDWPRVAAPDGGGIPGGVWETMKAWYVKGFPLSAITVKTSLAQHGVDIIRDLLAYYALDGDISKINTDSFDLAKNNTSWGNAAGVVNPGRVGGSGITGYDSLIAAGGLRETLTQLSQSFDLDLFVAWDGRFAMTTSAADFDSQASTSALQIIRETRLLPGTSDRYPGDGERWAPYNRAIVENIKGQLPDMPTISNSYEGSGSVDLGRVFERRFNASWRARSGGITDPWKVRNAEVALRPVVKFVTDIDALLLDLGDFFKFNWTRNQGTNDPYTDTIFKVESIAFDADAGQVEIQAVWRDDLLTQGNYLLDDESLLLRVASSGGRTATVADLSSTVTFSSGSLVTNGVTIGDILVLLDSTLADNDFRRYRCLRIASVTDATHLVVTDPDLDFGVGVGSGVVADWAIYKGARTYPTAVSDPTNYADGSTFYGHVSSGGVYSDATAAHKLNEG
jgi:hypothetical protein